MRFGKRNPAEAIPPQENPPTPEQAQKIAVVEKSRDSLHRAINGYRALLGETRLSTAKTQKDRDHQMTIFGQLNDFAGELNTKNAEEGTMALAITALNSVLLVRDEVNDLKFQNLTLHKRIAVLENEKKIADADNTTEE